MAEPQPDDRAPAPSLSQTFADAARRAGIGQVTPGETPTAGSLLRAIGGVRGLIESLLPGLAFLVIYTVTGELTPSVVAPVVVAVVFIVVRAVTRSPVMPAVTGLLGVELLQILAPLQVADAPRRVRIARNHPATNMLRTSGKAQFVGCVRREPLDPRAESMRVRQLDAAWVLRVGRIDAGNRVLKTARIHATSIGVSGGEHK